MGEYSFEGIKEFKYLGPILTSNNNVSEGIATGLWALQLVFKSKRLSRTVKIRTYQTT